MNISAEEFLKQVKDLRIVDSDGLETCLASSSAQQTGRNAALVARALIDRRLLTEYQAKVILRGKGRLLCMRDYVIREKIEKGGMGTVFLATHRTMQRDVAMKVLSKTKTHDDSVIQRFLREARTAAKLCHPNITAAFDAGQDHGHWFLVSEYVDGEDFQKLVRRNGPLFPSVAIDLILQAAKGLECAHEAGVTHRDIKPSNLMLNRAGNVKLLDLGLARPEDDGANARITSTDVVMGTPHYMAPEQAEQIDGADARSDVYSLGCTLFFLLTGQPPYNERSVVKALIAHRDRAIPDLKDHRDDIRPELQTVLERMMAKVPSERYQRMSTVIEDLESMKAGEPPGHALAGQTSSADCGLQRFLAALDEENADGSAEYYLDDGESHATVPTWQNVSGKRTTSVNCIGSDSRPASGETDTPARPRGAIGRIASGFTSMLSFLKLPG